MYMAKLLFFRFYADEVLSLFREYQAFYKPADIGDEKKHFFAQFAEHNEKVVCLLIVNRTTRLVLPLKC